MFQVNIKDTKTTSMTDWVIIGFFRGNKQGTTVLSLNIDIPSRRSGVFIVNFEHLVYCFYC